MESSKHLSLILFFIFVSVFANSQASALNLTYPLSFPLVRHKPLSHKLLEMGVTPDIIHKMVLGKNHTVTNDTVQLFKFLDSEYYAKILIGHPGQTFKIILDTTWGDSYVPSSHCSWKNVACRKHAQYDHSKSSLYVDLNKKFSIPSFGLKGFLAMDLVHLGHVNVTNHTFAELTDMPLKDVMTKADGLFGMGFKDLVSYEGTPFFYKLIQSYPEMPHIFSFYYNRDETTSKGGSLILGGISKKHYDGSLDYIPVTKPIYWQFHMDRVVMSDGKQNSTYCASGCEAIIDTGSSTISVTQPDLDSINHKIGATLFYYGRFSVDCKNYLKLPEITFVLNGIEYSLRGKEYIQMVNYGPLHVCLTAFVQSTNDLWSLGGTFLYRFYTVFDVDKKQIGFAHARL